MLASRCMRDNRERQRGAIAADLPEGRPEPSRADHQSAPRRRRGLFECDWRQALTVMLTLLVGLALAWVVWQIISPILHTIVLFVLAAVVAFVLTRPVTALTDIWHHRILTTLTVYALVGCLAVGGIVLSAGPFVVEATDLGGALPHYAKEFQTRIPEVQTRLGESGVTIDLDRLEAQTTSAFEQAGSAALFSCVVRSMVGFVKRASGNVTEIWLSTTTWPW